MVPLIPLSPFVSGGRVLLVSDAPLRCLAVLSGVLIRAERREGNVYSKIKPDMLSNYEGKCEDATGKRSVVDLEHTRNILVRLALGAFQTT
ncbi:hypothetical protein MUK42_34805 [Musa troglodytarum]|uniref:Uncharacterized protein n=1 Tax=Musa troglodytarum TaxID=320322 RepID=A0A9E7G0V0_9LILI|nr:hypothetical protein MUK42_34805 [Musa troglodytarum]